MPRAPEAYRRSTLFEALHKEIVVNETTTPSKKESVKDRITFKGSIKKSIAGLFRTTSQPAYSFDAADSPSSILVDDNGCIKAATLEKLIEKLTTYQYSSIQDIEAFLYSYRTYTSPLRLLELLQSRFAATVPKELTTPAEVEAYLQEKHHQFQIRVVRFIKIWFEKLPIDWADADLVGSTVLFFRNTVIPTGVSTTADRIVKSIEEFKYVPVVVPEDPPSLFDKSTFDFWAFPSEEIARQLTLIEYSNARLVKPNEFYKQAWTKRDAKKKAPGIFNLVKHFNKITAWVRTEILAQDILKYRVEMVRRFIELASQLHTLKNMNGLTEIVSALDSTPIQRLTRTWAGLMPQEIAMFEAFRNIISPQRSYSKYREMLKASEPPFIPYIGVNLADLIFIDEGIPDMAGDLCNFHKASAAANAIRDYMACQECPYNFTPSPVLQKYIQEFKGFSEDDAYAVSQDIEPRTTLSNSNGPNPNSSSSSSSSASSSSGSSSARKHNDALIGEISAAASPAPQQLLSSGHKMVHDEEGDVPFLDLRGSVVMKLQLLGASIPITVAFPRDTTAAQALEHLSVHLSGMEETSVLALMPNVQLPEGLVLDKDTKLDRYEGKVLVILNEPLLIRVGISKNTFLEGIVEVLVDSKAPLFSLVPILLNVFKVESEFSFLYVEGSSSARWLSLNRGLIDQSLNDLEGLLLLYPISNLQQRSAPSLTMTDKSGWLQVKIKSGKKLSIGSSGKRRWVVLLDHFLFIYKSPLDMVPKRVVSLENHAVRLERSGKSVHLVISRPSENEAAHPTVILGSTEGSNILYDWLSAMEKTCYHIAGKEHVFGAELSLARSGLPVVVEKCAIFLMAYNSNTKDLFFEPGNRAMIEYFKLQFDQGVDVEFTQYNTEPHTVAQLLKLYITQLPSPLLPWGATLASLGKVEALHQVVASIDSAYRTVLGVVLGLIGARYLEEKPEIADDKRPGDYWRIFLRVPEGLVIGPDEERFAIAAIEGLVLEQDAIFLGFKESTISRRLRVKQTTRKRANKNTTSINVSITDSPNTSWKTELANSANSAIGQTATKQQTAAKIEEAKARIEERFGLQRRTRAFSDSGESEIINEKDKDKDKEKEKDGGSKLNLNLNLDSKLAPARRKAFRPNSNSSGSLPSPSIGPSSSSGGSGSFIAPPVSRTPSVPVLKLTATPASPSPDSPLSDLPSPSRSFPTTFSAPYLSTSSPDSSPASSTIFSAPNIPPIAQSPPSPIQVYKPRSHSVPLVPVEPSPSLSPPSSPPVETPQPSNIVSPRGAERAWVLRRLTTKRNVTTPELNWGRACENCGKSFALNGEVACKGCGFIPNQDSPKS